VSPSPPPSPPRSPDLSQDLSPGQSLRLRRRGGLSIGIGLVLIVAATLWVANVGYGGHVRRKFAQRRSYNMVKTSVHEVLPRVLLTGLAGLGLILLGARMRQRATPPTDTPANEETGPAES
jgi:hypothetical protein